MTQPGVSNSAPLRRRTPAERVAYCQGYLAGMRAIEQKPGNALVLREAVTAELEAAERERES